MFFCKFVHYAFHIGDNPLFFRHFDQGFCAFCQKFLLLHEKKCRRELHRGSTAMRKIARNYSRFSSYFVLPEEPLGLSCNFMQKSCKPYRIAAGRGVAAAWGGGGAAGVISAGGGLALRGATALHGRTVAARVAPPACATRLWRLCTGDARRGVCAAPDRKDYGYILLYGKEGFLRIGALRAEEARDFLIFSVRAVCILCTPFRMACVLCALWRAVCAPLKTRPKRKKKHPVCSENTRGAVFCRAAGG